MAFLAVKKGCGGLGLAAVGDPALVGKVCGSTMELKVSPVSTRDEAWVLGYILLSPKVLILAAPFAEASFTGMVTVLLVLVTLVGATEGLAGAIDAEALVGSTAETLSASSVPVGSTENLAAFPDTETLVGSTKCLEELVLGVSLVSWILEDTVVLEAVR